MTVGDLQNPKRTDLKIDDKRTSDRRAKEKVEDVEAVLGRPARRNRE